MSRLSAHDIRVRLGARDAVDGVSAEFQAGTVTATSTPIHRGRRQQLWLVTITDEDDRPVARGQVRLQNLEG